MNNGDFALSMRNLVPMEDALRKRIPYRIYGGLSFIRGKKLKTMLFTISNPKMSEAPQHHPDGNNDH
jgi:superfamily I DNA/RNA helicase